MSNQIDSWSAEFADESRLTRRGPRNSSMGASRIYHVKGRKRKDTSGLSESDVDVCQPCSGY